MKDALLEAIASLFGVRPSDKTLNKYRHLWHPQYILEEERNPASDNPQETPASNPSPSPEPAPEANFELCPTPPVPAESNGFSSNALKSAPAAPSPESATPPLYMKVRAWATAQCSLLYQGSNFFGLVRKAGEKKDKLQGIYFQEQVIIDSCEHSSFLFNPDDEENLQVYVKPISQIDSWQFGIAVLAKNLIPL